MKLTRCLILSLLSAVAFHAANAADKTAQSGPSPMPDNIMTPGTKEGTTSPTADTHGKDANHPGAQKPTSGAKFAENAALVGLCEIEMARLAATKATSPAVKKFAAEMVTDHTKAADKLRDIAATKDMELPVKLDSAHEAKLDKLAALSGAEFDKAYVADNVTAHEKAVALFKEAGANCSDAELKAYAVATLPTLEMHLKHIEAIQKEM